MMINIQLPSIQVEINVLCALTVLVSGVKFKNAVTAYAI